MARAKVAITLDARVLRELDDLVKRGRYANRSRAIEAALEDRLGRLRRDRLRRECERLDAVEERALSEQGFAEDCSTWPAY